MLRRICKCSLIQILLRVLLLRREYISTIILVISNTISVIILSLLIIGVPLDLLVVTKYHHDKDI